MARRPDIAGQDIANPTAEILSAAMMLEHLGEAEAPSRFALPCARRLPKVLW